MTRLDPVGEPSMEEILASIRRIIAEDPPGSRPEPEAKPATTAGAAGDAPAKPAFGPLSARDANSETANGDSGLAPQTRETIPESKPFLAGFFSQRPAFDVPRAQPDSQAGAPVDGPSRSLPSSVPQALATDIDAHLADGLGAPAKGAEASLPMPALSIETLPAHTPREISKDSVQAALDSLSAPARQENRPGFTVSREGYLAKGAPRSPEATKPAPLSREPDPFEFTLGPSPFARKPSGSEAAPIQTQLPEGRSDPFGAFIPTREAVEPSPAVDTKTATHGTPFTATKPAEPDFGVLSASFAASEAAFEERASAPLTSPVAPEASEVPAPAPEASSANESLGEDPFGEITFRPSPLLTATQTSAMGEPASEVPQVSPRAVLEQLVRSTTSAPAAFEVQDSESGTISPATPADDARNVLEGTDSGPERASEEAEPEAERSAPALSDIAPRTSEASSLDFNAAAGVTETEAPDVEVVEPEHDNDAQADHQKAFDRYYADPESEADSYAQPNEGRSLVPHDHSGRGVPSPRTMEDTVAELLRPMLKTWLAENMPRIVERALRKELADNSRARHKPAAE